MLPKKGILMASKYEALQQQNSYGNLSNVDRLGEKIITKNAHRSCIEIIDSNHQQRSTMRKQKKSKSKSISFADNIPEIIGYSIYPDDYGDDDDDADDGGGGEYDNKEESVDQKKNNDNDGDHDHRDDITKRKNVIVGNDLNNLSKASAKFRTRKSSPSVKDVIDVVDDDKYEYDNNNSERDDDDHDDGDRLNFSSNPNEDFDENDPERIELKRLTESNTLFNSNYGNFKLSNDGVLGRPSSSSNRSETNGAVKFKISDSYQQPLPETNFSTDSIRRMFEKSTSCTSTPTSSTISSKTTKKSLESETMEAKSKSNVLSTKLSMIETNTINTEIVSNRKQFELKSKENQQSIRTATTTSNTCDSVNDANQLNNECEEFLNKIDPIPQQIESNNSCDEKTEIEIDENKRHHNRSDQIDLVIQIPKVKLSKKSVTVSKSSSISMTSPPPQTPMTASVVSKSSHTTSAKIIINELDHQLDQRIRIPRVSIQSTSSSQSNKVSDDNGCNDSSSKSSSISTSIINVNMNESSSKTRTMETTTTTTSTPIPSSTVIVVDKNEGSILTIDGKNLARLETDEQDLYFLSTIMMNDLKDCAKSKSNRLDDSLSQSSTTSSSGCCSVNSSASSSSANPSSSSSSSSHSDSPIHIETCSSPSQPDSLEFSAENSYDSNHSMNSRENPQSNQSSSTQEMITGRNHSKINDHNSGDTVDRVSIPSKTSSRDGIISTISNNHHNLLSDHRIINDDRERINLSTKEKIYDVTIDDDDDEDENVNNNNNNDGLFQNGPILIRENSQSWRPIEYHTNAMPNLGDNHRFLMENKQAVESGDESDPRSSPIESESMSKEDRRNRMLIQMAMELKKHRNENEITHQFQNHHQRNQRAKVAQLPPQPSSLKVKHRKDFFSSPPSTSSSSSENVTFREKLITNGRKQNNGLEQKNRSKNNSNRNCDGSKLVISSVIDSMDNVPYDKAKGLRKIASNGHDYYYHPNSFHVDDSDHNERVSDNEEDGEEDDEDLTTTATTNSVVTSDNETNDSDNNDDEDDDGDNQKSKRRKEKGKEKKQSLTNILKNVFDGSNQKYTKIMKKNLRKTSKFIVNRTQQLRSETSDMVRKLKNGDRKISTKPNIENLEPKTTRSFYPNSEDSMQKFENSFNRNIENLSAENDNDDGGDGLLVEPTLIKIKRLESVKYEQWNDDDVPKQNDSNSTGSIDSKINESIRFDDIENLPPPPQAPLRRKKWIKKNQCLTLERLRADFDRYLNVFDLNPSSEHQIDLDKFIDVDEESRNSFQNYSHFRCRLSKQSDEQSLNGEIKIDDRTALILVSKTIRVTCYGKPMNRYRYRNQPCQLLPSKWTEFLSIKAFCQRFNQFPYDDHQKSLIDSIVLQLYTILARLEASTFETKQRNGKLLSNKPLTVGDIDDTLVGIAWSNCNQNDNNNSKRSNSISDVLLLLPAKMIDFDDEINENDGLPSSTSLELDSLSMMQAFCLQVFLMRLTRLITSNQPLLSEQQTSSHTNGQPLQSSRTERRNLKNQLSHYYANVSNRLQTFSSLGELKTLSMVDVFQIVPSSDQSGIEMIEKSIEDWLSNRLESKGFIQRFYQIDSSNQYKNVFRPGSLLDFLELDFVQTSNTKTIIDLFRKLTD
ncbi:hypothetical protein SSS_01509 [Sarcoptes scabiei]|uniref:Uncharacterized protein n=2 Tax=Sarcoptes scabiei TaxID=52283 RepID=A0A834VD53_SARSC|nr:hypothetical protein SSS_01509 [Sarcoptes scabiei]